MDKRIIVIDGNSLVYRAFFALPPLKTKDGIVTNGIYGFLSMYYKIVEEYSPSYLTVVFDKKGGTFRHKQYEEYKAGRAKMPDELSIQFPIVKEILKSMNIKVLEVDNFEADDIAGTIANISEKEGYNTILVSGDRDYLQLVDENTKVLFTKKGITEVLLYDKEKIEEEYEMTPEQLIDLKGLMGDKSDNIPGVPGIGPKTGIKLIKEYGNIENIYKNIESMKKDSVKTKLEENQRQALMSKMLATIVRTVPLEEGIEDFKIKDVNIEELILLYEKYELKTFLEKISPDSKNNNDYRQNQEYTIVKETKELEDILVNIDKLFIKIIREDRDILGIVLVLDENIYFIHIGKNITVEFFMNQFKSIGESSDIEKYGYNIKDDIVIFLEHNIDLQNIKYDGFIGAYLIDPSLGAYTSNYLGRTYLREDSEELKDILGKGKGKKTLKTLEKDILENYFVNEISIVKETKEIIENILFEQDMYELFCQIELPLTKVMADMEFRGFTIDIVELERLKSEITEKIDKIKREIYVLADEEFNINSTKQLSEILFNKLDLPVIKKTKTGFSTNIEVLEKLMGKHPIIAEILKYRQLSKLLSTYIDGMENLIDPLSKKVHSKFNQTITSTGRISSTDPNLQNIPIRTEEGREIRKLFIPTDKEWLLVDADYSQIELRVLAHISEDEKLIKAFFEDSDIHRKTASEVFNLPEEEVDTQMRGRAKAVNFGIIYGISDYGLSRDLKITRAEAKKYIDNYFENYPNVKGYMDGVIKFGKQREYVETILKRRRYIPELRSRNFNIRGFGERVAMNTPIQGSAADIIKVAMVKVYNELNKRGLRSKLILQVHDELIVETHYEELEEVKDILKDIMENAVVLKVPLKVDMEVGVSWYETK